MREQFLDLSLPEGHPEREGERDLDPVMEAHIKAVQAEALVETQKQVAVAAQVLTAHQVIKAKAATDPAFAALVTVLGIQ